MGTSRPCPAPPPGLGCRTAFGIRLRIVVRLLFIAVIFAAFGVPDAFAGPAVGTAVTNKATATFVDGLNPARVTESNTDILAVGNPPPSGETAPSLSLTLAVSSTTV